MTAVPNWDIGGPSGTDAELARASAAGDCTAFAGIYDRYADRLHDFCAGMTGDRDGAADCVQDVFCIAATRLPQLRDPDKLRPWLYSIARNEALRRIRDRRRETPSERSRSESPSEPPPPVITPEEPPPPPPPPAWPDWLPPLPPWQPPPPPPGGGDLTGPGNLTGPTPNQPCSAISCP